MNHIKGRLGNPEKTRITLKVGQVTQKNTNHIKGKLSNPEKHESH